MNGSRFNLEESLEADIKDFMEVNPSWTESTARKRVLKLHKLLFEYSVENNIEENITEYLDFYKVPKNMTTKERLAYYQLLGDK